MKRPYYILPLLLLHWGFFAPQKTTAQLNSQLSSYSTSEGLPSNHVYDVTEDKNGFLWIATDNGVSRFDGKFFKNFTTKDGLPSNDVLQVACDGSGRVWVNCYQQPPSYYDETSNKFVIADKNDAVKQFSKSLMMLSILHSGEVIYRCNKGYIIINQKKETKVSNKEQNLSNPEYYYTEQGEFSIYYKNWEINKPTEIIIKPLKEQKTTCGLLLPASYTAPLSYSFQNQVFYLLNQNLICKIKNITCNPFKAEVDSIRLKENIKHLSFSGKYCIAISHTGKVILLDLTSLNPVEIIQPKGIVNCAYIDKSDVLWIGTMDKGLQRHTKKLIEKIKLQDIPFKENFLSVNAEMGGNILAGNFYGEVLEIKKNNIKKYSITDYSNTTWIRNVFKIRESIYAIHDKGMSVDFSTLLKILETNNLPTSLKTAEKIDDNRIAIGTITGLFLFNTNTKVYKKLRTANERIISIAKSGNNIVYYIGPEGVYRHDIDTDSSVRIFPDDSHREQKRMSALAVAGDNTVWAGNTSSDIFIFSNDSLFATIPKHKGIPENITSIITGGQKVWIGSKNGLCIIEYKLDGENLSYQVKNVSKIDGLPSNVINGLSYSGNNIYAATENGLAKVPVDFNYLPYNIIPKLVSVNISNANRPILDLYKLGSGEKNITLEFSGIDLSGHFKSLLYAVDDTSSFTELNGNFLNLRLGSGTHKVFVKAIDINLQNSTQTLQLIFEISTPFYRQAWFWILITALASGGLFWYAARRRISKHKNLYEQDMALQKQRQRITADLHDDIGSSLSSLQINSSVAAQLIEKDTGKAREVMGKVEEQSKKISEKIGDFIWSMKPGNDEFMTLSSRIRTFASDILGATRINYSVQINPAVDSRITDFTARKNVLLIIKEGVNNAVKYSGANEIAISLQLTDNKAVIVIKDNGKGMDESPKQAGNGLANMRKRAEELGGVFTIQSAPGKGAIIQAEVPVP